MLFTMKDAEEALIGHDEFIVKTYDGLVSFDYIVVFPGSFQPTEEEIRNRAYFLWESAGMPMTDSHEFWLQAERDCKRYAEIRRNLRGVTFDATSGNMLSLPLHKFFNVNQVVETQFPLLKNCRATIYEKLDGSMIHFFMHPQGHLTAATCRSTETPQAKCALRMANENISLKDMILTEIGSGYTPIFELVSLENQIVVRYPKPRLVYLVSRSRVTGHYKFDESFPDKALSYSFNFADIYSETDRSEFEGYVCHLDNGMLVKVKTPWYMERHRAVDALMRPAYRLYQIVFDGFMDDLIAIATEPYKPSLRKIYEEAQRDLLNEKKLLDEKFQHVMSLIPAESEQESPIANLEKLVKATKGNKFEALKVVRAFTGLGLAEAKNYIETGKLPHGVMLEDANDVEQKKLRKAKASFAKVVKELYPNELSALSALYEGRDPDNWIKDRLMEVYRAKYPNKLYADLEDDA